MLISVYKLSVRENITKKKKKIYQKTIDTFVTNQLIKYYTVMYHYLCIVISLCNGMVLNDCNLYYSWWDKLISNKFSLGTLLMFIYNIKI